MDRIIALVFTLYLGLAACQAQPEVRFTRGNLLLNETFETNLGWDDRAQDGVVIGVEAGAYRMRADVNQYVRGFDRRQRYENVIVEVQVVQLSAAETNAYGVVCRGSTTDGREDGYYFLVGGDGSYSIRIGRNGDVERLVAWARSGAVNEGAALNTIRAVCMNDYLALYVNDEFAADVRDRTYQRGAVGFTLAAEAGTVAEVAFDNLNVFTAQPE
jgi:hypothetical protein